MCTSMILKVWNVLGGAGAIKTYNGIYRVRRGWLDRRWGKGKQFQRCGCAFSGERSLEFARFDVLGAALLRSWKFTCHALT